MTDAMREAELQRIKALFHAWATVEAVRDGRAMEEPGMRSAIRSLMIASYSGRVGQINFPPSGGLLDA